MARLHEWWNAKPCGSTPLGDRVKQERRRRQVSIQEMAVMVNCAESQITGLENRGVIPHVRILMGIAKVLHCTLDWMVGLEDDNQEIQAQIAASSHAKL